MKKLGCCFLAALALGTASVARATSVLFDFNAGPLHAPRPLDLTVGGITAHFAATGQGFSIQDPATSIGLVPAGFSGYCLSPNSIFPADLLISFPQTTLTDFSILYAPQELATDSSATMRVTAYLNGVLVGTNTAVADPPGTWPSATLSFSSALGFNSVVVHYDSPPPTGGDYGPIFVADNMVVTPMIPEPSTALLLGAGAAGLGLIRAGRARKPSGRVTSV